MSALPRESRSLPRPSTLRVLHAEAHRRAAKSGFCAMVARALRCRRCSLMMAGLDGRFIVEESVGLAIERDIRPANPVDEGAAERIALEGRPLLVNEPTARLASPRPVGFELSTSFIAYPQTLPDGGWAVIVVGDHESGQPLGHDDLETLGALAAFYASTYDAPARRETLRLRGEIKTLRRQVIRVQEQERQRLARDLHDGAGHMLSAAILRLDMTGHQITDPDARLAIEQAKSTLVECADQLHDNAFYLRPRVLLDLGLAPALRGLARRIHGAGHLHVDLRCYGDERRYDEQIELTAFRIAQEATTNAVKHARAAHITLSCVMLPDSLVVEIADDGVGFSLAEIERSEGPGGQGLSSMRERAELVRGTLEIVTRPGTGATIRATLPAGGPA